MTSSEAKHSIEDFPWWFCLGSPSLILVKVEGLSYSQAAAVLRVPKGTVQSRVRDALQRLRRWLTEGQRWST